MRETEMNASSSYIGAPQEHSKSGGTSVKRRRWLTGLVAIVGLLIAGCFYLPKRLPPGIMLGDSWVVTEKKTGPVIGHLGGVPVSIPSVYAFLVEYDGDPHFLKKRTVPAPPRTYQSGIASFGFEVRFPDMASLTAEARVERRKAGVTNRNSTWLRVGVLSNSTYGSAGDDSLERRVANLSLPGAHVYSYVALPEDVFGLNGYTPLGVDKKRRAETELRGADNYDNDIFYHRARDGHVDSYIECSNVSHRAAPCDLRFEMLPIMRAHIEVSFRKELLPHWREIQESVRQVILGFRVEAPPEQITH